MTTNKIYANDDGTAIILDTKEDLATATAYSIEALTPSNAELSWAATIVETTKLRHITATGELLAPGEWRFQAKVTFPDGTWYGDTVRAMVYKKWR